MACRGDLKDALLVAPKAASLEPHRAGYHALTARILVAMGRNGEAIKEISFVAERFRGPDDDEAVELRNRISHENHPPDKELVENGLANTQISV
jgi:hypothetical protein